MTKPDQQPDYSMLAVNEKELQKEYAFGFLDKTNPMSLVNLLPPETVKIIEGIPKAYFTMKESELKKFFKCREEDTSLKLKFWEEHAYAVQQKTNIKTMNIIHGVSTVNYWYHEVLKNNARLAYVLRPPMDYQMMMRAKLMRSLDDAEAIHDAPLYKKVPLMVGKEHVRNSDGRLLYKKEIDTAVLNKKFELLKYLDQRVNGAILQKLAIEQRSMNFHVTAPQSLRPAQELIAEEVSMESYQDLSGQIKKLEKVMSDAKNGIIDATEEETDIDG